MGCASLAGICTRLVTRSFSSKIRTTTRDFCKSSTWGIVRRHLHRLHDRHPLQHKQSRSQWFLTARALQKSHRKASVVSLSLAGHSLHKPRVGEILEGPTDADFKRLNNLLRNIKGTLHYKMALRPSTTLPPEAGQEVDWPGCPPTVKSTSGAVNMIFDCPVDFVSKTRLQRERAVRNRNRTKRGASCPIICPRRKTGEQDQHLCGDGLLFKETIATTFGTSKKTRHIQL